MDGGSGTIVKFAGESEADCRNGRTRNHRANEEITRAESCATCGHGFLLSGIPTRPRGPFSNDDDGEDQRAVVDLFEEGNAGKK